MTIVTMLAASLRIHTAYGVISGRALYERKRR